MPLEPEIQAEVWRLHREHEWGGRKIAEKLSVNYGQVRRVLEGTPPEANPLRAVVYDLETSNLKADMGRLLVAAFLDLSTGEVVARSQNDFGGSSKTRERKLLEWTCEQYSAADVLIGHNIHAFDKNFLNGRREAHRMEGKLEPRILADTYLIARYGFTGLVGYSLENLADFFSLPSRKDKPRKEDWSLAAAGHEGALNRITERCVADVRTNAQLWLRLKPYWFLWRGK